MKYSQKTKKKITTITQQFIGSTVELNACSIHRLGEGAGAEAEAGVGTGSGRYKEAEAAVPGDHSTSLVAMMDKEAVAVAGPEEGMVVAPGHEVPGHEVPGTGEVDHRVA